MKIKKQYIYIGIILIAVFVVGFFGLNVDTKENVPIITEDKIDIENENNKQLDIKEIPVQINNKNDNPPISTDANSIKVSLTVLNRKYETSIKEGATAFEVMEKIQKESSADNIFDFKYTNNRSLGNFITEINGIEGSPGKYWIYYVNNKKPSVGVSNYILKEGDIINWSQEGI